MWIVKKDNPSQETLEILEKQTALVTQIYKLVYKPYSLNNNEIALINNNNPIT